MLITPIRLTFGEEVDANKGKDKEEGVAGLDDGLKKPYKEVLESPFTKRIIEFSALNHRMPTNLRIYDGSTDPDDHISSFVGAANQGEWEMPVWCRMFQQTLDGPARGWFDRMPNGCIDNWANLREMFVERFALRRRCSKDPTEVLKIVRKANESLLNFKERWTEEIWYIQGVPKVMQISAFMRNSKCLELARRFFDQVPQTVTEMMKRVDDFVKSEDAFKSTELPKGEQSDRGHGTSHRGLWPPGRRNESRRFENQRQEVSQLSLESLVKRPKEILATELQLQLPPPPPLIGTPKKENLDRYYDYHGEKGHCTNDCFQLKRQLEIALEPRKLNHLSKDLKAQITRQTGGGLDERANNLPFNSIRGCLGQAVNSRSKDRGISGTKGVRGSGSSGEPLLPIGKIELEVVFKNESLSRRTMMKFIVVEAQIEGKQVSPMKAPEEEKGEEKEGDKAGIPRRICQNALSVNPGVTPVAQKRRILGQEKSKAVMKEVEEWLRAGIVRSVRYPTWISNPVLVEKVDGTWRMCIDFKNLNSACLKDYYPLPKIDLKIEAVMGFPFKCFLDAYKGYHQIQMSKEDEEKTAFYTNQGTSCYTKMSFGLKNAGATYQRLVDSTFEAQLGRNLEAYVDDMVIKSRTEKDMIMDVMKTFDNLKKINMKLNPRKCSFRVMEGKFLGYMVTSEGIRANPKKTKAVADIESPKTLREMQSLSGKLAALNRFLSRSAERAMPFFDTLKNISKEVKVYGIT
ncbi:reverse transcriptase domain-containing protein [Tanacetum coccineum]